MTVLQDLKYGVRMLRRSPGFAAAAILSMALGIGANTAIFSLLHTLLLRPLPVTAPGELVEPISWLPESDSPRANAFAWKHFVHYRDHASSFTGLIAAAPVRLQAAIAGRAAESISAEYVVGDFFPMLGVRAQSGRVLVPEDDRADATPVAVISWKYWQARMGGDPAAMGQSIVLNGTPATIVGIAPRAFFGLQVGLSPDVWVPMALEPRTQQPSRFADGSLTVRIVGRLRPGVSRAQAEGEMRALDAPRVEDLVKRAAFWQKVQLFVEPAGNGVAGPRDLFAGPLVMLMAVVAILLLIACANIAALLLARASARQHEIAVRVALGASRGRLTRQLLTESLLLSGIGGTIGIALAMAGGNLLVTMLMSGRLPPGFPSQFDVRVQADPTALLFTLAAVVITGVLAGLAPAVHGWSSAPIGALRHGRQGNDTPHRRRFAHGLVAAQVALAVAMLSAAGSLLGHVTRLKDVDTGLERERLLLVTLDPSRSGYDPAQRFLPYRTLLERLEALPGIQAATVSAVTPVQGPGAARMVDVPGFAEPPESKKFIPLNFVGPGYFEVFGTPLVAGREFRFDDMGRPRVAIVNQAMARYYFGGASPIGRRFTFTGREGEYEIVGLVADAKYQQLTDVAPRTVYVHAFQEPRMFADRLSVRTAGSETAMAAGVQHVVHDVLRNGAAASVTTLDRQLDASIVIERTLASLSGFFGGLGALLTALGLYGLLAFAVARRTREIGIRMALGANRGRVMRTVLGGTGIVVTAGVLAGVPLAVWAHGVAARALPGFTVAPWTPIAVAVSEIVLVAMAAAYLPTRRATRVDPAAALQQD